MKKKKKSFPKKPALVLTAAALLLVGALSAVHAPHSLTTVRIIPHR